jgi:hypothetical protein
MGSKKDLLIHPNKLALDHHASKTVICRKSPTIENSKLSSSPTTSTADCRLVTLD